MLITSPLPRAFFASLTAACWLTSVPASAQFRPRIVTEPTVGENYHIEVSADVWNPTADWKALRLAYEYDFVVKSRGFGGFIIEDKQTDVMVDLVTPFVPEQFAHARAPIPALGGIVRVYPVPRVSITGEVTGFKLP